MKENIVENLNLCKCGCGELESANSIANKFNLPKEEIETQIRNGVKVEMEHTNNRQEALDLVYDHLSEFPDYYTRLNKMEKKAEKTLNENLNYKDMFNEDYLKERIPFLKEYNFFDRRNGIEAQKVVFHENIQKMYNGNIINFKQFNTSSEFIFYTNKINDVTFYTFILKNSFHPMIDDDNMNDLEKRIMYLTIKSISEKLSYSEELPVKDNQSIDENKLDEIFNNINKTLFNMEKESETNDTPLFEGNKMLIKRLLREGLNK